MDPQNIAQQQTTPVSTQPVSPVSPSAQPVSSIPQKKSSKLRWIILGVVVLIIGIGIGTFFMHPS